MAVPILLFLIGVFLHGNLCDREADRHDSVGDVGIIGGHQIRIEKVPFMASVRLNGTYHWCGASIIHEQFVLTAAHCIVPNREFKVLLGTDNVDGDGQLFETEEIIIHERYNRITYEYDFCLIKLKSPVTFSSKVAKINLPPSPLKIPKGSIFNITGWGATGSKVVSPKLLQVEVPLVNRGKCSIKYALHKFKITPKMLCAGTPGHDSCQGDSGGPLTLGDMQVGVTSFGLGCGVIPGVYAKVSSVREWILEKINS